MANQSSLILHNRVNRQAKHSKITIGLSKSLVNEGNKLGFSGNHDSLQLKNMDSTRILGPDQDHKRRCFEVEDAKCALEAQVIDDTALIETTVSISGFKNRYGKHPVIETSVLRNPKQESDGKKGRNKAVKKLQERCSMKCLNEKKLISTTEKRVPEVICQKGYTKMPAKEPKVKYGYQKKDIMNPKIFGEAMQETDVNSKVSDGIKQELTTKLVETEADTVKSNPVIAVNSENNEPEDQTVHENTSVGSKKVAYSREDLEALRSVDEEGQKGKWAEVYSGFTPSVAREYTELVVDANNRLTQRYTRTVNCGSTRGANAIFNVPPVLPLCSPTHYM